MPVKSKYSTLAQLVFNRQLLIAVESYHMPSNPVKDKYHGTVFMILDDLIFWPSSILLSFCTILIHKKTYARNTIQSVAIQLLLNSAIFDSFWSLKLNRGSIKISG